MKRVNYDGSWQKPRGYSPMVATEGGRILWLSGHVGAAEASGGWDFAADFETQVHQTFRNIEATLARAGGRLQDIVTMTAFIINVRYSDKFIEIRKQYFPDDGYPCSALVSVAGFAKPGIMIEIQTIAVIKSA
ncbi:MAG: RidA family protein [Proteobacteria bacterium]|nr:RidA family protein [Pseudomonadota bacterium]